MTSKPLALLAPAALLLLAAPAAAQSSPDLRLEFAQTPRLALQVPVTVRTTGPATYRGVAELRVGERKLGEAVARGTAGTRGTLIRFRVPGTARARAAKEARRRRLPPRLVVTVTAAVAGRPTPEVETIESALRQAPFYDGRLRVPDASREATRRFAISWDLPFEFTQIYGAMAGTPSVGSFRKYVAAQEGAPRCALTFSGRAETAGRPGTLGAPVRARGTRGAWRWERGATRAVLSRRAPARLPGTRPWVVVRFGVDLLGDPCRGEIDRTVLASLRRAIATVQLRFAAPQLGPGFGTA